MYIIEVVTKYNRYIVERRYQEFYALLKTLNEKKGYVWEGFPRKTLFRCYEPQFLEKRRSALEAFIQDALMDGQKDTCCRELLEFLKFDQLNDIQ